VAGEVPNLNTGTDGVVVKLSGTTGVELWRTIVGDGADRVRADAVGDVIALAAPDATQSRIVKLAGDTGLEVWQRDFANVLNGVGELFGTATFAVASNGDVIALGYPAGAASFVTSVFRLAASDGHEVWRHDSGSQSGFPSGSAQVALLPAGDVIASDVGFGVAALSGVDGHELWQRTLGCQNDDPLVAVVALLAGIDVAVAADAQGARGPPRRGLPRVVARRARRPRAHYGAWRGRSSGPAQDADNLTAHRPAPEARRHRAVLERRAYVRAEEPIASLRGTRDLMLVAAGRAADTRRSVRRPRTDSTRAHFATMSTWCMPTVKLLQPALWEWTAPGNSGQTCRPRFESLHRCCLPSRWPAVGPRPSASTT
jgi:hypothetical protein